MVDLASDPADFELEVLEGEITELAGHLAAATCRWLELVASFDERRGWEASGCHSCAHWLSWRCGIAPVTAREQVRVARALGERPVIRAAFAAGELTYTKVRSLVRLAGAGTEADLVELARHATGAHLATLARARERVRRAEAADAHRRRELAWHVDDVGDVVGTFRLPAVEGFEVLAGLRAALTHLDEPADAAASPDLAGPDADDAAASLAPLDEADPDEPPLVPGPDADAASGDAAASLAGSAATHPGRATLAGALVAMARAATRRHHAPAADSSLLPPRTEVVVHVEAAALTGGDGGAWIHDGPAIAPEVARRLACDGVTRTLVHDHRGTPLDLGRRQRTVNPALRLALEVRDGGCVFPGCGRRHFLHAHHIVHWADGGPTTLTNLALVCSHHHHLLHDHGWDMDLVDGHPRFLTPDDEPLRHTALAPGATPHPVVTACPAIDPHTIEPRWGGEHLDVALAIDALLSAERLHQREVAAANPNGPTPAPVTDAAPRTPTAALAAA